MKLNTEYKRSPGNAPWTNWVVANVMLKFYCPDLSERNIESLAGDLGGMANEKGIRLNWLHSKGMDGLMRGDVPDQEAWVIGGGPCPSDQWEGILEWAVIAKHMVAKFKETM